MQLPKSAPTPVCPALYLYPIDNAFIPKKFALTESARVKIGRQSSPETVPDVHNGFFRSKTLSRQHAEVWEEGGKIYIKDIKSANGTFLNGVRLSADSVESEPHSLKSGDIVEFGVDIYSEDFTTIAHPKIATRVTVVLASEDAQAAAWEHHAQLQRLQHLQLQQPITPEQPRHGHQQLESASHESTSDGYLSGDGGFLQSQGTYDQVEDARETAPRLPSPFKYESDDDSPPTSSQPELAHHSSSTSLTGIRNKGQAASDDLIAPAIGGTMSASDIISQLTQHGCQDITKTLNLSSCTRHPISTGGFGDIYQGNLKDGSLVAIKCMRVFFGSPDGEQKHLKYAAREIHTWSKCEHRHVLKLLGLVRFRGQIGMVAPWVTRGSLNNYLGKTPETNRPQLCAQVADGLAYLHSCGVVHGDLKGANVLLSDDGDPLLTDFGNAVLQERTLQFTYTTAKTSLSPRWAAPELIRGEESFSFEADVFALGMTILEIITGTVPYSRLNDFGVMYAIAEGRLPERPEDKIPTKSKHGDRLWSVLTRSWERTAKSRPGAGAIRDEMIEIQPEGLLELAG